MSLYYSFRRKSFTFIHTNRTPFHLDAARTLFEEYGTKLKSPRERTEVALAYSLLEEYQFRDLDKASRILCACLQDLSIDKRDGVTMKKPLEDSRLPMALVKLEGRQHSDGK